MADGPELEDAHARFRRELEAAAGADGGVPWTAGADSEPEPTALTALALDHDRARSWLTAHQADDGSVLLATGEVRNTGAAGLVALAMPAGTARDRALDFAIGAKGATPDDPTYAGDPPGWAWVPGTFAWVEPTSRVLLATRILRPGDTTTIDDGVAILEKREIEGGGWNYGNASVKGTDLSPYVQTTAAAVMALAGLDSPALGRGVEHLRTSALQERGGMSLAMSLLALRLAADEPALEAELATALHAQFERTAFLGNLGALAWAALATRPDPNPLQVGS